MPAIDSPLAFNENGGMKARFVTFLPLTTTVIFLLAVSTVSDWAAFWKTVEDFQAGLGSLIGLLGLAAVTGWSLSENRKQTERNHRAERSRADDEWKHQQDIVVRAILAELKRNEIVIRVSLTNLDDMIGDMDASSLSVLIPPTTQRVFDFMLPNLGHLPIGPIARIIQAYSKIDFDDVRLLCAEAPPGAGEAHLAVISLSIRDRLVSANKSIVSAIVDLSRAADIKITAYERRHYDAALAQFAAFRAEQIGE